MNGLGSTVYTLVTNMPQGIGKQGIVEWKSQTNARANLKKWNNWRAIEEQELANGHEQQCV